MVSIPLESGHVVIFVDEPLARNNISFNPLRIGSCCNLPMALRVDKIIAFQSP